MTNLEDKKPIFCEFIGQSTGINVMIITGIHGNELSGVLAVRSILENGLQVCNGKVGFILAN